MCVVEELEQTIEDLFHQAGDIGLCLLDDDQSKHLAAITVGLFERAGALAGEVLHVGQERLVATRAGHRTMEGILAAEGGHNAKRLQPLRREAQWLVDFPTLAAAYRNGTLTRSHVADLQHAHNNRLHTPMVEAQELFVEVSRTLTFPQWRQALARWVLTVDPDGAEPVDDERGHTMPTRFGLKLNKQANGDVEIRGLLPPIEGEALETAIETATKKLLEAHSDDCESDRLPWRQLRIHGLMTLVARGYARENARQQAPLVNLVLSQDRFEQLVAQMTNQTDTRTSSGVDPPPRPIDLFDPDDLDGRCETMSGTPLRPQHVQPYLDAAVMRRHVFGAELEDLEVSKQQRLFPKHIADALKIRYRGLCATPGCPAPLHWLHTDHIQPFSLGGPTIPANGRPYCSADNQWRGNDVRRGSQAFGSKVGVSDAQRYGSESPVAKHRVSDPVPTLCL